MSHSYFLYETGEQKLERLRKQRIDRIKKQLREAGMYVKQQENMADILSVPDRVISNADSGFSVTDTISDELISDVSVNDRMKDSQEFKAHGERREKLDLSAYISGDNEFQDERETELANIINSMNDRIPDSDKARSEYDRLMNSVDHIVNDDGINIENKIHMVSHHVNLYIENRNYDNSALDEDLLLDYKALCILLGLDEEVVAPEMLKDKVDALLAEYYKLSDKEVVADAVNEALQKIGVKVEGSCVLDAQIEGEVFSLEDDRKCKIFISCDESGIMIEPINDLGSAADREIMAKQKTVCETERKLIEEVAKNGVKLNKVYSKEHEPSKIATGNDVVYEERIAEGKESRFDKQRNYNKLRRNRRRREQDKSRSIEL